MLNFDLEKPKLALGDRASLFYIALERLRPKLKQKKRYIKFRKEYEDL